MPVTKYEVSIVGATSLGSADPRPQAMVRVSDGEATLGFIKFFAVGALVPADIQRASGSRMITEMNLPVAMLGAVIDILRNEKPVLFNFGNGRGQLGTLAEPVGEGESQRA